MGRYQTIPKAEGCVQMSNASSASIRTTAIHQALQQLLDGYQRELAESQADNDTRFTEYWECACRTIYEVAEALNIPFDDPWVDPSWIRSVEYQTMLQTTRTERRLGRTRLKTALE